MASELRLITNTAEGDPMEFAAECLGDGPAQRSLANAWRSMKTQDRAVHVAAHLLHSQKLKNPALHLLQPVVVLLEDIMRHGEVQVVLGAVCPWQVRERLQVRAADHVFWMVLLDVLQSLQLPLRDFLRILAEVSCSERLAKCSHVVLLLALLRLLWTCVPFAATRCTLSRLELAHLPLKLLHLPAENHLAQLVVPALLHLRVDLLGQPLNLRSLLDQAEHQLDAFLHVECLEDLLPFLDGKLLQARSDVVSEDRRRGWPPDLFAIASELAQERSRAGLLGRRLRKQFHHDTLHVFHHCFGFD
mmetsp:Transcript_31214/g.85612  ORF Transcript_31214/g.85612 Transcript_31214/m.85612 type:complete len:303 (-) Transcript_31214:480-1388(-)